MVFPNATSINLSRTIWSDVASASINFHLVVQLIWRNSLCTSDIFLSDLGRSTNLIELQLDNSTICLSYSDEVDQWYSENIRERGGYPYAIFWNLNNCTWLTKFSCTNCQLQWHSATEEVPDLHSLPGQMCSQWLIRNAPLSLRLFSGPIYTGDLQAVLERYSVEIKHLGCFQLNLHPQPLDNNDYFDVEHIKYV